MFLVKQPDGRYIPYDDADYEESKRIVVGGVVKCKQPRNYDHHKLAFALLQKGFHNQSHYEAFEIYRKAMTILAGYYDEVKDKKGSVHYFAHSLSYENMSKKKFEQWYDDMVAVVSRDLGISTYELIKEL